VIHPAPTGQTGSEAATAEDRFRRFAGRLDAALLNFHSGQNVTAAAAAGINREPRRLPGHLKGFAAACGAGEQFSLKSDHLRMHLDHTRAHSRKNFNGRLAGPRVFDLNPLFLKTVLRERRADSPGSPPAEGSS